MSSVLWFSPCPLICSQSKSQSYAPLVIDPVLLEQSRGESLFQPFGHLQFQSHHSSHNLSENNLIYSSHKDSELTFYYKTANHRDLLDAGNAAYEDLYDAYNKLNAANKQLEKAQFQMFGQKLVLWTVDDWKADYLISHVLSQWNTNKKQCEKKSQSAKARPNDSDFEEATHPVGEGSPGVSNFAMENLDDYDIRKGRERPLKNQQIGSGQCSGGFHPMKESMTPNTQQNRADKTKAHKQADKTRSTTRMRHVTEIYFTLSTSRHMILLCQPPSNVSGKHLGKKKLK
ncbi:hypothetical protein BU17DRAFT_68033 [Hysterangium stoloniferum]|nr:hypothetical protein BU17DRAFT_68033 [Hysterangium stoloniferum]